MIKKLKLITYLFIFYISFIGLTHSEIPEKIEDLYQDFKKDAEKLNNELSKLKNPKDAKLQAIDESLNQINQVVSLIDKAYEKENLDLINSNLNFLTTLLNKSSNLIPGQYENDLTKIDNNKMKGIDSRVIASVSNSMKVKRIDKHQTLLEDMVSLEKNGVDAFKINNNLNKKGISIISTNEIAQVVATNPNDKKFKDDVVKELKSNGATKDELVQIEKGIAVASLQPVSQQPQLTPEAATVDIKTEKPSEERLSQITVAKTLSSLGLNNSDERQSTGVPYDEFSKLENELYSQVRAVGFDQAQTEQVMFNLKTKYVDVWFHGKEVYESILTNGGTIQQAQKAQQDWLNGQAGDLNNWASLFGLQSNQTYSLQDYLQNIDKANIPVELASADRIAKEAQARVLSYFTIDDPTGERGTAGKIMEEATAINNKVKEAAMKYGISEDRAQILAANASTYYLDAWHEGTLVSEGQLARGYTWEGKNGADQAVLSWWDSLPENSYIKQWDAKLYNPSAPDFDNDLDYIPDDEALQNWFASLTEQDFTKLNPSDKRVYAEGVARTLSYLKFDDKGNITGEIITEAQQVQKAIIDQAAKNGYDKAQAETLAKNAATRYLDIWFGGTIVSESELAKGNTWEEADAAVDKWAETSEFKDWISLLYGENERFEANDNFFARLDKYFKDIGFLPPGRIVVPPPSMGLPITSPVEPPSRGPFPGAPGAWDPDSIIAQNLDRKMEMSEIKSNKALSNVMNSMSDKQVYGLLASGVINDQLVNEYIKNGKNAPILACGSAGCEVGNLKYTYEEANRQMQMSNIKGYDELSKVMNSLTDRQAYELIASGAIPSDLVNEYIKNGLNAPVQPCGTNTCDMIEFTKSGRVVEPGQLALEQQALTEISKDLIGTGNFDGLSAADALGDGLAEAVAEIQASLNEGAVVRGADGQEISVQEALESMPEGGQVNPDGTLEPVAPGAAEDPGCGGTC